MSAVRVRMASVVGLVTGAVALAVLLAGVPIRRHVRGHIVVTQVTRVLATVQMALELSVMTERFAVSEGDYHGGILLHQEERDVREALPGIGSYNPDRDVVIWTYEFVPLSADREGKWYGHGWLTVHGTRRHDGCIYAFTVPRELAAGIGNLWLSDQ